MLFTIVLYFTAMVIQFTRVMYSFEEGNRQVDAILQINRVLSCCPFSVRVRIDEDTSTATSMSSIACTENSYDKLLNIHKYDF